MEQWFWFNLKTGQVEEDAHRSRVEGPARARTPTRAEAERRAQTVPRARRNGTEDRQWEEARLTA